jgi:uncharacterized protein (TIGR02271 family)
MASHRVIDRSASGKSRHAVRDAKGRLTVRQVLERADSVMEHVDRELVIPLLGEELSVAKQVVETGRVTVARVTREQPELIAEPLVAETVEISRVPIGRQVETMPAVRHEGETTVIPIVEERLLIERRLFLKEEVRVRRVRTCTTHRESVTLRHHEVVVNRRPGSGAASQQEPDG